MAIVEASTSKWDTASINAISATGSVAVIQASTSKWDTASINAISATGRIAIVEASTSRWDTASLPSVKFLANIGETANPTYGAATVPVLFTNLVYKYGGTYSNTATVARWIPGTSGVMIRVSGGMSINVASQPVLFQVKLYKNGTLRGTMMTRYSSSNSDDWAMSFNHIDITTSVTDFYEVYVTSDKAGQVTLGSGADNWWAGEVIR